MDLDFLVFPSPKCSYNKTKLGNELIFIPKYAKTSFSSPKKLCVQSPVPNYFSKQILSPSSTQCLLIEKHKQKINNVASSCSSISSLFNSPRRINVKLEMNNSLTNMNKKDDDDQPVTPLMETKMETKPCENKSKKLKESSRVFKKQLTLQDHEKKKSFFIKSKNDFDEGIDFNSVSSPKKILEYRTRDHQTQNPFKLGSPTRAMTTKTKTRTSFYFNNSPVVKSFNQSVLGMETEKVERVIPCLLLEPENWTDKILVYFHGNAEDIYLAYELLYYIERYLRVKVLAVEYPGYGVYTSHKPNSETIQEDALAVYDYLIKKVGFEEKNIMLLGRSIGSGPASYLASLRNPGALIMMSSFTSLRSVVNDHVGSLDKILKERFNNHENIKNVKCPSFFIHGLQDKLISYQHSQKLHDACGGPSELCLPKEMTHSEFCFDSDFIIPLENFLRNYGFDFFEDENGDGKTIKFPQEVYKVRAK